MTVVKKSIIEYELEEINNLKTANRQIDQALKHLEMCKLNLIQEKQENNSKLQDFFEIELEENDRSLGVIIKEHIPGEKISMVNSLFPPNLFVTESFRKYAEYKNIIQLSMCRTLEQLEEKWDEVLVCFSMGHNNKLYDLDNYYYKPYVDGIRQSGLICDDNAEIFKLFTKNKNSIEKDILIDIYNKKYVKKYIDEIMDLL